MNIKYLNQSSAGSLVFTACRISSCWSNCRIHRRPYW